MKRRLSLGAAGAITLVAMTTSSPARADGQGDALAFGVLAAGALVLLPFTGDPSADAQASTIPTTGARVMGAAATFMWPVEPDRFDLGWRVSFDQGARDGRIGAELWSRGYFCERCAVQPYFGAGPGIAGGVLHSSSRRRRVLDGTPTLAFETGIGLRVRADTPSRVRVGFRGELLDAGKTNVPMATLQLGGTTRVTDRFKLFRAVLKDRP